MYYQETQIAKAQVINMGLIPTFTLKSSNDLVRTICPKCLNSSIKGEFQVDLGQLAREMAEKNITLWMSWDLHSSRKVKCKEGGLTWLYSTESSMYDHPHTYKLYITCDRAQLNTSFTFSLSPSSTYAANVRYM